MRTPAYIQVVGLFNQSAINLATDDSGGELDPHGADFLGNPLGGLVYSSGLSYLLPNGSYAMNATNSTYGFNSTSGVNGTYALNSTTGISNASYQQTQSWNTFVGSNVFCFKLCDPSYNTTKNYCQK